MAERVQQNQDLGFNSPLRVVAKPTDAYFQVKADTVPLAGAQQVGGGDFKSLAESIGLLTPVLQKAVDDEEKFRNEKALEAGRTARLTNQKSFKEAQDAGLIRQSENPWFIKGYLQQDGRISGMNYDIALRTAWMDSPAKNSDNPAEFQQFQSEFRAQWIKEHDGKTPDWMDGFAPKMAQADNNMAAQHVAHRQQVIEQSHVENTGIEINKLYTEMAAVLNAPQSAGADAEIRAAYQARIEALGKDLVAKGFSGHKFNQIVTDQTIAFARQSGDEDLLELGRGVKTPGGTIGGITDSNSKFAAAEHAIRADRYTKLHQDEWIEAAPDRREARAFARESMEHSREVWQKQRESQDSSERVKANLSEAIMRWQTGEADDPAQMNALIKDDPSKFEWFQNFKHTRLSQSRHIIGDETQAANLMIKISRSANTMSPSDIYGQVHHNGISMAQANTAFSHWQSKTEGEGARNKDPYFRMAYDGLTNTIGGGINAVGEQRWNAWKAGEEFSTFYDETIKDKNLPQSEKLRLIDEKSFTILKKFDDRLALRTKMGAERSAAEENVAREKAEVQRQQEAAERTQRMSGVSQEAINLLRSNPSLVTQFEKAYGLRPGEGLHFLPPQEPLRGVPGVPGEN